ncbi:MAG: DUF1415 family protein, partial [Burkholderiales bacterium]|nr:DUF1415 family protein [Burkholderiales bacterium]
MLKRVRAVEENVNEKANAVREPGAQARATEAIAAATAATRIWLERAVIGLNLCPFAKAVHAKDQIRYVVSDARSEQALLADLARELQLLAAADADEIDTTLLIHPYVLEDFLDYNEFLDVA